MSKNLVYQEQKIVILFNQSIEFSIIDAEMQTIIFLFDEQDELDI